MPFAPSQNTFTHLVNSPTSTVQERGIDRGISRRRSNIDIRLQQIITDEALFIQLRHALDDRIHQGQYQFSYSPIRGLRRNPSHQHF